MCYKEHVKKKQAPPTNMPATLAPTPGSMASLSIEEGSNNTTSTTLPTAVAAPPIQPDSSAAAAASDKTMSSLETAGTTVPTVPCPVADSETGADDSGDKDSKKKKNRCLSCKKKVGLTGFTCRCGGLFCGIHRYSDKHECAFDYKALGAEEISKSNPVVVAEKVAKI